MTLDEKTLNDRIDYFLEAQTTVHIMRTDKMFFNGKIVSREKGNVIILNDRKLGLKAIFLDQIYSIDEYVYLKKEDKKDGQDD